MEMSRPFLVSLTWSVIDWALPQEECEFGLRVKVDSEELKWEAASRTRDIICRA